MKKIDQVDIIILKELIDNSNISIPKLAKKTNLNQSFIFQILFVKSIFIPSWLNSSINLPGVPL